VQSAVVVLDLNRPRLVVIVVLVAHVYDGGDDVGVQLLRMLMNEKVNDIIFQQSSPCRSALLTTIGCCSV
jgi:hypothetical protein